MQFRDLGRLKTTSRTNGLGKEIDAKDWMGGGEAKVDIAGGGDGVLKGGRWREEEQIAHFKEVKGEMNNADFDIPT
jgi:hypothetical protein